jgi:thiamine-monophosphate kinase
MELEFIHWLRDHVPPHPRAPLGLFDDAALISLANRSELIATIDTLTDGVDFQLTAHEPRRIGRQALAANLSDLAAMASEPIAAIISIVLPRHPPCALTTLQLAIALYEGLLPLAEEFGVAIAGGDVNTFDGPLAISVTALGQTSARGPLLRSGARPGDWLLVTGQLGGSILGHMLDFTPRVRESLALHERYDLHAGTDISDGLALDASRLATASGCGAVLFTDRIPIAPAAFDLVEQEQAADSHAAALLHALSDGQDFELLLAAPPNVAQTMLHEQPLACFITQVGELISDQGLWQQSAGSPRRPLEAVGWRHQ